MSGFNGNGVFTKTYNWETQAGQGVGIRADEHEQQDQEFVSGFNLCLLKDGQSTATANIPMGTFRFTNVGDATARNEFITLGQFQDGNETYAVTAGSANAYTITLTPAITAYTAGQRFILNPSFTNTGAATVNINGVGAQNIYYNGNALNGNEIVANKPIEIVYDGTQFNIISGASFDALVVQNYLFNNVIA